MPRRSLASRVSAMKVIGTLLGLSSRGVAGKVISCKGPLASSGAVVSAGYAGQEHMTANAPQIAPTCSGLRLQGNRLGTRTSDMLHPRLGSIRGRATLHIHCNISGLRVKRGGPPRHPPFFSAA